MAFFSVIIPLYNKENHIEETLKSVLNQNFQDFEVIIVEDCSTDNSNLKAESIISEKIRIIQHEVNKGLSASRNTGIQNSNSDFLAFLDADDIWHKEFLEKIHQLIQEFPKAHLFATNYVEVYSKKVAVSPSSNLNNFIKDDIILDFFESNLYQNIYCPSSLCVKKELFEKIGGYNTKINYGEDIDFNIRANSTFKLAYSNTVLVYNIMYAENKITNSGLKNKTITDFDFYEPLSVSDKSLKKYLDINRYMMASNYKKENDLVNWQKLKKGIHKNPEISGLNLKQRILLELPPFVLQLISKLKLAFLKKGKRFSSFN
ncbi:glycosyltransferase family 2 protein [Flavobacterium limnophilum]|uniref:glycosyltransferase family 2 protein n=1 Tax=Flavobacterium limnophilum TaxID=3003262 RepID=UPI0022ABC78A|nr:glycosyltransferase family A protein [Flavobacterium limnophilum]